MHNTLSGVDDGVRRRKQRLGGLVHRCDIRTGSRYLDRAIAVHEAVWHVFGPDVRRNLNHYRARPTHLETCECSAHRLHHQIRRLQSLNVLGDGLVAPDRAEVRIDSVPVTWISKWKQQHRHGIRECCGDPRVGILSTGPVLHSEDARWTSIGNAAVSIRDTDTHALLPADDRPDADVRCRLDHVRGREGAQVFDAFLLQNMGDGVKGLHDKAPSYSNRLPMRTRLKGSEGNAYAEKGYRVRCH